MNILISGSRSLTNEMNYALALVGRCKELGATVLVGDAAGIDNLVLRACHQLSVPCIIHHIARSPRHLSSSAQTIRVDGSYTHRDEYMVEHADLVMCVWDGTSRGTKHVFDYAKSLNKQAYLKIR